MFEQVHTPGERGQSDFTHMQDLGISIAGEPFAHLVYHFVLIYSNVEAASICFSETFEALAEGIEDLDVLDVHSFWQSKQRCLFHHGLPLARKHHLDENISLYTDGQQSKRTGNPESGQEPLFLETNK